MPKADIPIKGSKYFHYRNDKTPFFYNVNEDEVLKCIESKIAEIKHSSSRNNTPKALRYLNEADAEKYAQLLKRPAYNLVNVPDPLVDIDLRSVPEKSTEVIKEKWEVEQNNNNRLT